MYGARINKYYKKERGIVMVEFEHYPTSWKIKTDDELGVIEIYGEHIHEDYMIPIDLESADKFIENFNECVNHLKSIYEA